MPRKTKLIKKRSKRTIKRKKKQLPHMPVGLIAIVGFLVFGLLGLQFFLGQNSGIKPRVTLKITQPNTGIIKFLPPTKTLRVPILIYHYVEYVKDSKDTIRKSLNITPYIFERQLTTLIDANFNFITARDLGEYLNGSRVLPERPVILTFDDGYGDFYTDVFPILKKYHVVATQYIVPGFINKLNYMTTEEIREIQDSGLVEIGTHTMHHVNLAKVQHELALKEITNSKKELEEKYGIFVVSFAYPYGGFNEDVERIVKDAGFTNAVTTKGGIEVNQQNRFLLYRIHPGYRVGQELVNALL